MSHVLDPIREQVARLKTVRESNALLLTTLTQKILDAPTLEDAKAIAQEAQDNIDGIHADIVANTPAETPQEAKARSSR